MGSILVVNAGSTSLKLKAVAADEETTRIASFEKAPADIEAVAHRVVHGGMRFRDAVLIDDAVVEQIKELVALAPLHNGPALEAMDVAHRAFPQLPHIAVFDTSFHRAIPPEAAVYALPRAWREDWGIRRYGFHGLSVEWCAKRVPELLGLPAGRLVVCHLGGGSSVTAVVDGRSVDTTMGFTPLEGVPMITRSGSVDPGALLYLLRERGLDVEALDHALSFDSGVEALAGVGGGMIEIERLALSGDVDARLALDVMLHRLAAAVAAMSASAGGLDAIAFTAGIGENSALVRERLCGRLRFLGVDLDIARNARAKPDCDVATDGSPVRVLVIQAREELIAARVARALIAGNPQAIHGPDRTPCGSTWSNLAVVTTSVGMSASTPAVSDVVLRDGSTMRFHPPGIAEADELLQFFRGLSDRSLYLRFHGHPNVDSRLVEPVLEPDWSERGALVGTKDERVVALASYVRLRDARTAEVAFAVADELQGRGIATRLLERLAALAGPVGIQEFVAEVMPDNLGMLRVLADAGFEEIRSLEGGTAEVRLKLAATESLRSRIDLRDHVAVTASLEPFFKPASLAVVGASSRSGSIGGELFRNVLRGEFRGVAYPVNRSGEPVAGVRAYRSVAEIEEAVDLAVVCLPGDAVLEAAEDALAAGVRALCVISAGFAEIGPQGEARQDRLVELVRSHGARLLGPNCLGIAVSEVRMNATFGPQALPPGPIGFSSQSGALGLALLEHAVQRRLGLSSFVSVGNKADVSSNDLLEWWEDDPSTDVVLLYLESFGNPRKFARVARRLARTKPIVAMKAGRTATGAKAASSHTAALAGSEAAVDALFHQAGVIRVDTLEELLDVTGLLAAQPLPHGRRVAVLTNAGGLGILCADACETAGLSLPPLAEETVGALRDVLPGEASLGNPVDMLGSAVGKTYADVLPVVLRDPGIDAVIVLFVPPVVAGADEVAEAIAWAVDAPSGEDKPVLACVISQHGTPQRLLSQAIAAFDYPESAARALGRAADRSDWLRREQGRVPELSGVDAAAAVAVVEEVGERWLTADEVRRLLEAYGLPLVSERVADNLEQALDASAALGYPVVVKTAAAGVHKTERGGVALDLRDAEAVADAVARIGLPVLVQPFLKDGIEILVGAYQDPVFGPLVALGPGGTMAELIGDAGFRLAPLTDVDAEELAQGGKAGRLLEGFRGAPPADRGSVVDVLLRIARLADDLPQVAELDLNPVMAGPSGSVVVDARARIASPRKTGSLKSW